MGPLELAIMFALGLLVFLVIPAVFGLIITDLFQRSGRGPLLTAGIVHAVFWMATFALLTIMIQVPPVITGVSSVLAGAAAMVSPIYTLATRGRVAMHARALAPLLEKWLPGEFDWLDVDKDGLIKAIDVEGTLLLVLRPDQREYLELMQKHFQLLGHVVGTETHLMPMTTFNGTSPMTTIVPVTTDVYAVSRADIPGFAERIENEYRNW